MKYLTRPCLVVLLAGCTATSDLAPDTSNEFALDARFNIPMGHFEKIQKYTWIPGDSFCAQITMKQPNSGEQWAAMTGIFVNSADGNSFASLNVGELARDSEDLTLYYRWKNADGEETRIVLRQEIQYGETVPVELFFPSGGEIGVRYNGKVGLFKVDFEPNNLNFLASSAISSIRYTIEGCDEQATID